MRKIDIEIADDHTILRSGVKMLINVQPDMRVVAEAANTAEILASFQNVQPDILLLDIGMPGGSGLIALKQVRMKQNLIRVIMLTMHNDVALLRSALADGASGFVLKQAADTELLSAIRAVHNGGLFIDPSLAVAFVAGKVNASPGNILSRREEQILRLVAQGYSNQEIGKHLFISVKTAETYKARIAEKLGLHSRKEITRYAVLTGMVRPEDFSAEDLAVG